MSKTETYRRLSEQKNRSNASALDRGIAVNAARAEKDLQGMQALPEQLGTVMQAERSEWQGQQRQIKDSLRSKMRAVHRAVQANSQTLHSDLKAAAQKIQKLKADLQQAKTIASRLHWGLATLIGLQIITTTLQIISV